MAMVQSFQMRGGPHDGFQVDPSVEGPHPETLYLISFDDGTEYARTGDHVRDSTGRVREVFDFDEDGSLTERAKRRLAPLL